MNFNKLIKCNMRSMKCIALVVLSLVFCQNVWGDIYSGKPWDEVVSESDRPTGITTNQQGNYVITLTKNKHLAWYAWKLNTETNSSELKKYSYADVKLGADIDMSGYSWRGIGEAGNGDHEFHGTFDGQGHTISKLVIERYNDDTNAGLFDELNSSVEIKNVVFKECKSYCEVGAGIVSGNIVNTSDVKFTNLTFDNCFVAIWDEDAGFVVGRIANCQNVVFDNITIKKNCKFSDEAGDHFGGITGVMGWGDNSVTVKNSFIALSISKQNAFYRIGGVAGLMDHASRLDVDNCVFDISGKFFTGNHDQAAIIGNWATSSKPIVRRTLVVGDYSSTLPNGKNVGLFGGFVGSSSQMELYDCFIHYNHKTDLSKYQIVSQQIVDNKRIYSSNVQNIDKMEASATEALAITKMNECGACFGINPSYTSTTYNVSDFVVPLSNADGGKLLKFTGGGVIAKADKGMPEAFTKPSNDVVIMAQGKEMRYVANQKTDQWIVEDASTNLSNKKRTGKWEFTGTPTKEGKFDLKYVSRPVGKMKSGYPKYNQTTQRVVLSWSASNVSTVWSGNGKWVIYKNSKEVASLQSSTTEWTDLAPGSGTITYEVFFVNDAYFYDKGDNPSGYPKCTVDVSFNVNLKSIEPSIKDNKVVNTVNVPNAQVLNDSRLRLLRWDTQVAEQTGNKPSEIIKRANELTVYTSKFLSNSQKDDEMLAVTYEDEAPQATNCNMYQYMWVMDEINDSRFKGQTFNTNVMSLTDKSDIVFTEFTATKGKSTSKVSLKWTVKNPNNVSMKYVIYRNVYDKDDTSSPDTWTKIYETNSGLTTGSFDDETLPGYVYKYCIRTYPFCEGTASKMVFASEKSDIGFAASRGTIQGRVTFNSGKSNVEGVDVRLQSDDDELATSMLSYAVQFEKNQYMPLAEGLGDEFWDDDWTLQFLIHPEKEGAVAHLPARMQLMLKDGRLCIDDKETLTDKNSIKLNTVAFDYVILKHTSSGYQLGYITLDENDKAVVNWTQASTKSSTGSKVNTLYFGCNKTYLDRNSFTGHVDEIRLWKGVLSNKSIGDTYNRYLSGNEKGLMAYYTFDSGVGEYAFDSSHPSGNWNNRHSVLPTADDKKPVVTSTFVPDADVLTYRGTTDKNGEYTISGIPFAGEGTNWQIVPSFGAHDFSPTSSRRLISTNTLVHSSIDFTDISSFKVQGRVYYENTNIPVQGCNITIDGTTVQEGTSMAETNADGEFSVDVPIGTHALAMNMNGHTFTDSLTMYFNKEVKDLWFYDNTTVVVAGRICGGELEYALPVGLAASKNNIGTAYITLKPSNDNYYFTAKNDKTNLYVVPSDKQIDYANPLNYTNDSWAHTGKAVSDTDMGDANRIYIKTDSLTGEFAASLPPMRYEVIDIQIPSADEDINSKLKQKLSFLDARNTTQQLVDSVWNGQTTSEGEQVYDKFTYNTLYKEFITSPATLEVWQIEEDKNFFGEDTLTYIGSDGKEVVIATYRDGKYTISAEGGEARPLFKQFENYVFSLRASQKYLNKDDSKNIVEDVMPMAYKPVTINNGMAYENYWYVDENGTTSFEEVEGMEFTLDSLGCGVYKFKTGTPNTAAPFEETISMDLDYGLDQFNLTGVILGTVSYGNSFVTRGPSIVSMILRDPPGSKSYATWTKGSTVTTGYEKTTFDETQHGENTEAFLGYAVEKANPIGIDWTIGTWGIRATETQDHMNINGDNTVSGFSTSITTTQDISTSSNPEFDGPDADLFIGSSVNTVSGNGKQVALVPLPDGKAGVKIDLKDVKTSAFTFNTSFVYSQYQIKKTVMPNLLAERRKLIEDPASLPADSSLHYVLKDLQYADWLKMTDEEKDRQLDKGLGVGYDIKSAIEQYATDSIELYRLWVEDWKNVLRNNEKAKVDAYAGNYLKGNYTFDAASSQTFTTSANEMKIIKDQTDLDGHIEDAHVGAKVYLGMAGEIKGEYHQYKLYRTETRNYENEEKQEVMSFTLAEDGPNDILTVDHMIAPDGFGDIFRTRGGQTSAFWAPQYVTEYYLPGTEIMAPTLMVNKPRLELVDPTQQIVSNVRRGTSAAIQFRIINDSETKTSGYYRMCLEAENNRNGAVCTVNGSLLNNDGVGFWLEYGTEKIVTINVSEPQSPVDDSYNLNFYLIDDKQMLPLGPMSIYPSKVTVQVNFVKSSSEINLATDDVVINAESIRKGNAKVRFTLKDYDLKMDNLLYFDLQQWDGTKFISLGDSARWQKKDGLDESTTYVLDMSDPNNYPDGDYKFRARTVSNYGEGEVEAYSDEITILKDVTAPQPVSNLMPVRGVLGNDNEISVEFNEDIVGDIRKNTNVVLYGELVNNASARETSVSFNGGVDVISTDVPIQALQKGAARSFNLWVKWAGNAGTMFTLGANSDKSRFGIDQNGHFTIIINTRQHRSETVFEKNKWTFLSIVIDGTDESKNDSMYVTASYILEDGKDVVWLMGNKDGGVPMSGLATTAAPLFLGTGFHGCIQDFSMWDGVRDMETSNNEKSLKKTRFTPNLLAYWPLNEGYGKVAKEVVSEQNMYLPSENMWSIENNNYAMRLDKGQQAQLVFSNVNTNYDEDYLLQLWFNVDGSASLTTGVDTLLSYPNGSVRFLIQRNTGKLVMTCKQDSIVLGDKNVTDGYWHQLSMMVKKSENGNATVYLDGNNMGQIAARKVDTLQGVLYLGDKGNFSGYFDEIRIWNGLQNTQNICENLNKRYSTTDCPVAAYFPFEVSGENQAVDFTLANYGNMKADGDTVRLVATDPSIPLGQLVIARETENVAPLKSVPTLVTRDFSIVSSERKIRINIDETELRNVQGTTVSALVRGLHDKAGNTIQDIRWSFLVEMNDIEWGDILTVDYNQTLYGNYLGSAKIINNTGLEQSWRIDNVPYWMELSCYGGVLKPNEKMTLTINAKESMPIGTNTGILSLVDSKGMYHKQSYSINNIPNSPEWEVDSLYAQVMTVTGQVRINRVVQENSLSKLAAFNTLGNCVGVATPEYVKEKNTYYYTMMIHGNDWYVGKEVTFKFYDANNGVFYASVEPNEPIVFGGDYANTGSIEAPIYWDTTGKIEQIFNINTGWNWISFNTQEESPVEEVFKNPQPSIIYTEVKDKNNFARYYNGKWEYDSDFGTITHSKMYKVKAEGPATITRIGTPVNQSGSRIRIVGMANGNPGWSWIGANVSTNMPLTTAMGGLTSAPKVGDIIKNQDQFAEYTTSGWIGRLNTIIPGKGYMYMSNDEANKYLVYPVSSGHLVRNSSSSSKNAPAMKGESDDDLYAEYGGSATMIAAVESDGIRMAGCRIYAIDNENNIRGCKVVSDKDDRHLAYLVIHGNDPETVGFKVVFGEGDNMQTFESATTFDYYDGLSVGTSAEPFVIKISGATGIKNPQSSTFNPQSSQYDLSGRPVSASQTKLRKGVYIKNNKKVIFK